MRRARFQELNAVSRADVVLRLIVSLAIVVVGLHAARQAMAPAGSIDLHAYWYAGHFVREVGNPYAAYLEGAEPRTAPTYLDGGQQGDAPVRQGDLSVTPGNAAPMMVTLAPLAWLTWPAAKLVWLLMNLVLVVTTPFLVRRLMPDRYALTQGVQVAFVVGFLALQGTRISIWVGQTTLLVFVLAVIAVLLRDKRPWLAGLFLGLALSKVTLIAPFWIFFVAIRRFRVAAVAIAVQIFGLVAVAGLDRWTFQDTLRAYAALGRLHAGLPGVHLAGVAPDAPWIGDAAVVLATVVTCAVLWRCRASLRDGPDAAVFAARCGQTIPRNRGTGGDTEPDSVGQDPRRESTPEAPTGPSRPVVEMSLPIGQLHVLTALVLLGLLVVYHRAYDSVAAYLFVGLIADGLARPGNVWRLTPWMRLGLATFCVAFVSILVLPPAAIAWALSAATVDGWVRLSSLATTAALTAGLAMTLLLLRRAPRSG